jgi:hypothetical protein
MSPPFGLAINLALTLSQVDRSYLFTFSYYNDTILISFVKYFSVETSDTMRGGSLGRLLPKGILKQHRSAGTMRALKSFQRAEIYAS